MTIATSLIAQTAFRLMGLRPISSYSDDSDEAVAAAEQYDHALNLCLEAVDWGFASIVASLPPVASAVAIDPRLPYAFALPGDCLVLREVITEYAKYRRDNAILRADVEGPLVIRYTARVTNEALMPETFGSAVAHQLALVLAPTFVEVQGKIDQIASGLQMALRTAARTDARTSSSSDWREDHVQGDWAGAATL